ncbi:MAG TPA: AraC family transcriptional regulator [Rhizobacter sp.]|nr:AraC family transcriptional regulator [Rhizobacter sp.]
MAHLVKADELNGYEEFARSRGLDPAAELAAVGLSGAALREPDGYIRFVAFSRLLENAAAHSESPLFGMEFVRQRGFHDLEGPLSLALRHASTLEEALALGVRYDYVYGSSMRLTVAPAREADAVDLLVEPKNIIGTHEQATEFCLARIGMLVDWFSGSAVGPESASFAHPARRPPRDYAALMGCACHFDAPTASLRFARAALVQPLPHSHPMLFRMCLSFLESNFGDKERTVATRVRTLISQWLPAGPVTMAQVAEGLAMHPKTLQRRLDEEGHTFDGLLDQVRKERFVEVMRRPDRPALADVAHMLGYSDQTALSRVCKRWFGVSPGAYAAGVLEERPQ